MVTHNGLMRIFWPSDVPKSARPGVIVGWRNSDWDVIAVGVLQDVEVRFALDHSYTLQLTCFRARNVENALRVGSLFRGSPHPITNITDRCGRIPLQVLGTINQANSPPGTFNPQALFAFSDNRSPLPQVFCPENAKVTMQIISYDPPDPNRMQYLSLAPISLTLSDHTERSGRSLPLLDGEAEEEAARRQKQKLVEKLRLHTVIKHPKTQKELALPIIVNQINCAHEINQLMQKNIGLVGVRSKRSLSMSERVVESATNVWDYLLLSISYAFWAWVYPVALQVFIFGLITQRMAGEVLLQVMEWRPSPDYAALKDISATAQQVDIRLQQFCYWPAQYLTLRKRRSDWESITNSHPEYIRFYNSLWLVANDVIIGIALGSYIIENAGLVASQVDVVVGSWFVEGLQRMISWLMDWPAGLKLNNELAAFLGDLFLWVIDYWAGRCRSTKVLLASF